MRSRDAHGRTKRGRLPLRHEELESRWMFNAHPAGSVPRHIHTRLSISIDGQDVVIPASVGHPFPGPMIGTFNEDAHTHSDDGVLHYNEGTTTVFRNLKNFFDTWGAIFTHNRIRIPVTGQAGQFIDRTTDATHTLRFLVNGGASDDFELYEPEDGDQMMISYEALPANSAPRLNPIPNVTLLAETATGAATRVIHVPLDGSHPDGTALQYQVSSSNPNIGVSLAPASNRSLRLNVSGRDIDGTDFTGDITIQLFEDLAPRTTARILELVNQGFYDDLTFHRVINDFVAQGGDPDGTGAGGSGTEFADEYNSSLLFNGMAQIAMANSGDDTNDSQFFITDSNLSEVYRGESDNELPPSHLNFQHSIFGQVTSGFDTFYRIMLTPVRNTAPITPVRINQATVFSDTQHAVLRISAAAKVTGKSTITVTARDPNNRTAERKFLVDVRQDELNDRAFLHDLPANIGTKPSTPLTINLPATDLENDSLTYVVRDGSNFGGPPSRFTVNIDPSARKVTLTPKGNFQGTSEILIGVRDQTRRADTNGDGQLNSLDNLDALPNFDTQKVAITVTPFSFTNAPNRLDVDDNGAVTPLDALLVINELTDRELSDPGTGTLPIPTSQPTFFLDVNADGSVTPLDALLVINDLPSNNALQRLSEWRPDPRLTSWAPPANAPSMDAAWAEFGPWADWFSDTNHRLSSSQT